MTRKKEGYFIICLNCGKKKDCPKSRSDRKFCCPKCYYEYLKKAMRGK